MSRYVLTTIVLALLLPVLMMSTTSDAYPYAHQAKPDPFAALASTLRRQQEMNPVYGYEEMDAAAVAGNGAQRPESLNEDDEAAAADYLWRLEELQRQLGRAAVLPFYGVRPQRNWMMDDDFGGVSSAAAANRPLEGHVVRQEPPVIEYGVPVVDEVVMPVDQGESIWYDDLPAAAVAAADFGGQSLSSSDNRLAMYDVERQKQAENELLLNTLAEYMLLYDSEKAARLASGAASASASAAAGLPVVGDKAIGQRRSETTATTTTTTTAVPSPSASSSSSRVIEQTTTASATTAPATDLKARKPVPVVPVQVANDGTLMGQKEFPMMRPAVKQQQRKQWLTTTHGKLDFASKRHFQHRTSQSDIRTPEDRLTRELDSLKAEKN